MACSSSMPEGPADHFAGLADANLTRVNECITSAHQRLDLIRNINIALFGRSCSVPSPVLEPRDAPKVVEGVLPQTYDALAHLKTLLTSIQNELEFLQASAL